ncbi:MAG: hypothetical protein MUC36_18445 [Planctomycetes bacterium]|jgi:hypothetical protein|nr:hypothetical protein [Planctomycetota bacterium]
MSRRRAFGGGLLALLVLQAIAVVPWHAPRTWLTAMARPSPDLLALLGLTCLGALAGRRRLFAHGCAALLVVIVTLREAVALLPLVFQRPFELADFAQLPALVHLLTVNQSTGAQLLLLAEVIGAAALLHWLAATAFGALGARAMRGHGGWLLGAQLLVLGGWLLPANAWHASTALHLADLAAAACRDRLDPEPAAARMRSRIEAGRTAMAMAPAVPHRLTGVDVYVLIVESYGATALRQPEVAPHFASLWQALGTELQAAGFEGVAGFAAPSILGGSSWLSHMELFTAVRTDHQQVWEQVLRSDCPALPEMFRTAGWRTVEVMPAMDRHWPEGQAFYGFDRSVTQLEMPYAGHVYPWGRMPDQFALHWLLRHEVELDDRPPLFAAFVSVSSHAPWAMTPPYVADWRLEADTFPGGPAHEHATSVFDVPNGPRLVPAFRDGLEYALRTMVGFTARLSRPSLVLVLGDHQPPIGWTQEPLDRSRDVPVHLWSNRPELLTPWRDHGFVPGFAPSAAAPSRALAELAPLLLRTYGR